MGLYPPNLSLASCNTLIDVKDNDVTSNDHVGITGDELKDCEISGNTVSLSSNAGLALHSSFDTDVHDNTFSPGNNGGISMDYSHGNTIMDNTLGSNENDGISLHDSNDNEISGNDASSCGNSGISLRASNWNQINNNILSSNNFDGIFLLRSNDNTIEGNTVFNNTWGIGLSESDNNEIMEDSVYWNYNCGILAYDSIDNRIYHNDIVDNANQSVDSQGNNHWDNGYPDGGNFWNDYTGTDQYQGVNQNSEGNDGIGDTPYEIDEDSQDEYPLMEPRKFSKPSAPQNPRISFGDSILNLRWEAPNSDGGFPVTNYRIYRGTTPDEEIFLDDVGDYLTYSDSGLINGKIYYYRVSATNAIGEGIQSEEESAIPAKKPTQPTNLIAQAGDSFIYLVWDAPDSNGGSPVTAYKIYQGVVSGNVSLFTEVGNETNSNDTSVINDVTYYYSVSAVNLAGEGPLSEEVSAIPTKPPNQPPTCTISSPVDSAVISGIIEILGSASDPDGTVQYIEIKFDEGVWNTTRGTTSWEYIWDSTVVPNGNHTVHVRSFDGQNLSIEVDIILSVNNPIDEEEMERSIFEEGWFWLLIAIVLIAFVSFGIAILLWKGSRKRI